MLAVVIARYVIILVILIQSMINIMSDNKLLQLYQGEVLPAWIDYNGHMNVAFYVLAFDQATDALLDYLGMDEAYREREQCSVFTLETHVNYLRELHLGEPLRITTQLLDYDAKRVHYFEQMFHAGEGYLAATTELIILHMDMRQRRGAPMPNAVQDKLAEIWEQHRQLPKPEQVGSVIGIRRNSMKDDRV